MFLNINAKININIQLFNSILYKIIIKISLLKKGLKFIKIITVVNTYEFEIQQFYFYVKIKYSI